MKKIIVLGILILSVFYSCERDDICIDDITPHLIIGFYDNESIEEFKSISQLSVKIDGVENDSLSFISGDSILIPLKTSINTTRFVLTNSSTSSNINRDTLFFNYTSEEVFVGRACGYKAIFNSLNYDLIEENPDSLNWIKRIEVVTTNIENEDQAHVKIFH